MAKTVKTDPDVLAAQVETLGQSRVLCIGDLMLDRFVYGVVERTSPEAPIPVLRMEKEHVMLGGVGNVVRNIVSLGASACLISIVGDDEVGRKLTSMIGEEPQVEPYLLVERDRLSTSKTRYLAGGQQLLRTDRETTEPIAAPSQQNLLQIATESLTTCDAVVLSDYSKGVLTDEVLTALIGRARTAEKPVVIDPKGRDFGRYRGATVITPNRRELAEASGKPAETDNEIAATACALIESCEVEAVLVTRGREGITIVEAEGRVTHLPAQTKTLFDVSGAGDTVVATFAAALGQGVPMAEAAQLANIAGGIVVGKTGTAAAEAWELTRAIHATGVADPESKILPLPKAAERVTEWRREDARIGFTNGCFDLLHPGHVALLREAKGQCDRLVVGLNSDDSVRLLKGPDRPIQLESARADVLASLEMVDLVVIFGDDTPMTLLESLRPDLLAKGADYTLDEVVGADFVRSYGGKVVLVPITPEYSTTETIAKLRRA